MDNKFITLLNDIVNEAVEHGGDSGGPYLINGEGLQISINNFLEYLKLTSINNALDYQDIKDYHAINYNNDVYIEPSFIQCRKIDNFEDYVFYDEYHDIDIKNKLLENLPKDLLINSDYKGEFLFINYSNIDYFVGLNTRNHKYFSLCKDILYQRLRDDYFIEVSLEYLNDLYEEENKEELQDFTNKHYFDYLIIKI